MIDSRTILVNELLKLGVNKYNATVIALDAGSSQCVVNKEYLNDINIDKSILEDVYKKVVDFYCGELIDL